jgi:uncharacterized protein
MIFSRTTLPGTSPRKLHSHRLARSAVSLALFISASTGMAQGTAPTEPATTVTTIDVSEGGLVGKFYRPGGDSPGSRPAVLVLGGSEGGLRGGMPAVARELAANGFAAFHLAYFGVPGLPDDLELIPMEYFQRALSWLQRQPGVARSWVGVVGVSKGAEAALVLATLDQRIQAVVAGAPSSHVWPGLNACDSGRSSWSLDGSGLPALPCGVGKSVDGPYSAYSVGLKRRAEFPASQIKIQNTAAAVLLVCGERDKMNPACEMSRQLVLQRGAGPSIRLLAYPDAGHLGFGVPVLASHPNFAALGSLGGSPQGNAAARLDSWPVVVSFLGSSWAESRTR